jgi:hypothetical protein
VLRAQDHGALTLPGPRQSDARHVLHRLADDRAADPKSLHSCSSVGSNSSVANWPLPMVRMSSRLTRLDSVSELRVSNAAIGYVI